MVSLTAQQLNERLEALSKYSHEDLEGMTVKALRKKLSDVGVKGVERDGAIIQLSSAKKVELITAIQKVTVKEKVLEYVVPDLTTDDLEKLQSVGKQRDEEVSTDYTDISIYFYEQLKKYTAGSWDANTQSFNAPDGTLAALAGSLKTHVERMYPDTLTVNGVISRHNTRLNARGSLLKRLETYIDKQDAQTWVENALRGNLANFRKLVFIETKADSVLKKVEGDKVVRERADNRSVISITKLIHHAYEVLSTLTPESSATLWKEVALSLVLLTGRRPFSEVFCTAEFEKVGEYEVKFTGQAKTKGKSELHYADNPSYNIPTLVKADLVVNALEWLGDKGKRIKVSEFDNDEHRARAVSNKRYSKDVASHMKTWLKYIETLEATEKPKDITPHTLREIYALAACRVWAGFNSYEVSYAARILGHDKDDATTAHRYQQDFDLSQDSICKI